MSEKKFYQYQRIFKHSDVYKEVIDLFIFKNQNLMYGDGQYSMYVASKNGVLIYEGIDKRDSSSIVVRPITNDYKTHTLTMGAIDCSAKGQIVFDLCSKEKQHSLKCFFKTKPEEKYDYPLEGEKKMLKFFGNYVIEVKTEKAMDKIQIYDFDNKLSLFNATYPQIFQVEVEKDAIFLQVRDKNGKLAVFQLIEMEHNLKI